MREGFLTLDQSKKRGMHLASKCLLCKREEENLDHLIQSSSIVLRCMIFGLCLSSLVLTGFFLVQFKK